MKAKSLVVSSRDVDDKKLSGKWHNLSTKRRLLAGIGALAVMVILCSVYYVQTKQRLSPQEQQAVAASETAAVGFKPGSAIYDRSRLNKAVEYADAHRCAEARAIVADVTAHVSPANKVQEKQFKTRIDNACSTGKSSSDQATSE